MYFLDVASNRKYVLEEIHRPRQQKRKAKHIYFSYAEKIKFL